MADKKFALKRNRTSKAANLRNRARISELKTLEKKFRAAVSAAENDNAAATARALVSALDKAAKVGTIHANRAANKKSQVGKLLNTLSAK